MNAVIKAIQDIKFTIPREVLQIGFVENFDRVNHITSIDERIINSVIRPRVLTDCNLVGGVPVMIDISQCVVHDTANREYIIEVPKRLTNNRPIVSCLSLVANHRGLLLAPYKGTNPVMTQATHMFNSLNTETIIQTARLELIGENTILVNEPYLGILNATVRVNVAYDDMMSNLHPRSFIEFSKLCIYAVKAYIYNNCKVKLDQGYVYGGHELGSIGEIIDNYSDSEEMYQEHLNTIMGKVLFLNEPSNSARLIATMLGNTL